MAASSAMAASLVPLSIPPSKTSFSAISSPFSFLPVSPVSPSRYSLLSLHSRRRSIGVTTVACLPSTPKISITPRTRLFVSGLSFRTTEDSLRNAFQPFGRLVEVNLVMDRIANRPRGFAFIRYGTEEESKKAIDGMHGKFLDGRVIFVEVAKPRSELHPDSKRNPKQH